MNVENKEYECVDCGKLFIAYISTDYACNNDITCGNCEFIRQEDAAKWIEEFSYEFN